MMIAKVEINDEILELRFDTEADAGAAMELMVGACYLGGLDMEVEWDGSFLSTADAEEFHLENRNMKDLAKRGIIRQDSADRYSDRFLFREWCQEGNYLLSGEDASE